MKQSGMCPKCDSTKIWNNIHRKQSVGKRWIMVVWGYRPSKRKWAIKDEYVCLDCGYSETFIDEEGIETIKEFGGFPETDSHKDSYFSE